jgi:iron-sulfur cluster repair protein YtfE (RIC family)
MAHQFIQHLEKDHEKQRRLGEQLRQAKDPGEREKLRKEFHNALYPHMIGEEASLFPYMESAEGKAHSEAQKALQEHHVGKVVLRELMDLSLDSDIFNAKAYVLDELNRHHMEEEEQTHFPMLEKMAGADKLQRLFEQYEEAEKRAKEA